MEEFWRSFRAHPAVHTPRSFAETVDKDHGRLETRRCYVFDRLDCLDKPGQWKELNCFAVLESERIVGDKTTCERRLYIGSLAPDAERISHAIRSHWAVENPPRRAVASAKHAAQAAVMALFFATTISADEENDIVGTA